MRAGLILDGILNELKSRDADGVERKVIGAAGIAHGECIHTEVFEWLYPSFKDGSYGCVLLQVHAADFSGAVVYVEVGGDFCLLRLDCDLSGFAAQQGRHIFHPRLVHAGTRTEMMFDVTL